MCRIHGHFAGAATPHEMRAAAAMQLHGGPDAQGCLGTGSWALGNNRLAIMDLAGGQQPYRMGEDIVVVFNGEIYNHHELRSELASHGYLFADRCDGSILPALYHRYGLDFAEKLDGMFSVAIVDLRREPTLILATDDSGMKPLYYRWNGALRQLTFASEIPALLAFRSVSTEPWLPGLDVYLATRTPFGEQTMFADIRVLPAGTTAWVTASQGLCLSKRRKQRPEVTDWDVEKAGGAVLEALREEVHRLALADVPVSAITSGGLDSSFVTALLAEKVPELHTFNIAYTGEWPFDERAYAAETAARCGTRHHQVEIDPARFPELLTDVVWHLGQPNADPITLSSYVLFDAVHRAGFKVAVTGDAADEIFGGYARIATALSERGDWVPAYVEALSAVPRTMRDWLYTPEYRALLTEQGRTDEQIVAQLRELERRFDGDRLAAITEFELDQRLPAYHLRRVDHLSMAHAVEVRLPFCQPRIIELARSLPAHAKVSDGRVKRALYAAARDHLPASVLNRPKQPFTLPITAMLHEGAALITLARDVLGSHRVRQGGLLNPTAVASLIERQVRHPSDATALAVWSLLVHQLWRDQFGAHTGAAPQRTGHGGLQ